ncbi:NAD(P)/FAD-dependent oxidoreductase [Fulvivirga sedimenti]|uniref:FAD-binding oxidoreductase n=1 Tax=Fulvivirga sedimenti TaxID=2879465 RepID=A0A9X1HYM5_9BACT|nr:FAD-dependent oxidoreductase [Fulvivirga sedimenti]MCA6078997.1 FAD-binding oxidoreductase [Fulvivirga sedimenti]
MYHYCLFIIRTTISKNTGNLAKTATILGGYDYLIIGQGLAGTALGYQLHKKGAKVCIYNSEHIHSSSRAAAGLYNPVTGRKMVKTWMADLLFPSLTAFYHELEDRCSCQFLHQIPIYRPFLSVEEQNEWMGKSATNEFEHFIQKIRTKSELPWGNDPLGGIVLAQSGYLDIPTYLNAMREWFQKELDYYSCEFDISRLQINPGGVRYEEINAKKIIFCDGTTAGQNPFFSWLPFRPVKGEILEIEMEASSNEIFNRGIFILPLGGKRFRVGSTYDNHDLSWEPTREGRGKIEAQLKGLVNIPYTVVNHYAGVRPATADRRPIIGDHPNHETICIFNGLGTKGVSLAPYFAGQLTNHLEGSSELIKEVNINRYFSLY